MPLGTRSERQTSDHLRGLMPFSTRGIERLRQFKVPANVSRSPRCALGNPGKLTDIIEHNGLHLAQDAFLFGFHVLLPEGAWAELLKE